MLLLSDSKAEALRVVMKYMEQDVDAFEFPRKIELTRGSRTFWQ